MEEDTDSNITLEAYRMRWSRILKKLNMTSGTNSTPSSPKKASRASPTKAKRKAPDMEEPFDRKEEVKEDSE
jgi:hypothetical protein